MRTTHLFGAKISWSQPDEVLGWRFTAGSKYWSNKENDHPITGRINSYGWRDKEWLPQKPDNLYRIAVLGDSYVEGFEIESDQTFLTLTEQQLNSGRDTKVELMNFGRAGFGQAEELLVLKNHIQPFSPDMVILLFLPISDIQEINKETSPYKLRPFYNVSENGE